MKDGRYFSKTENRFCWVYHHEGHIIECDICGKVGNNLNSVVWEDDEQHIEWNYGNECIKKLKLTRTK